MKTIYLVRHGQKQPDPGDPGLTDLGVKQSIQTGEFLKNLKINQVISSPFKRTLETAKNISSVLNIQYQISDQLVERMNWEGGSVAKEEFQIEWNKATNDRNYQPKFGNSSKETGNRIEQFTNNLQDNSSIILVTHGGAIMDYVRNFTEDKKIAHLKVMYKNGEDYTLANCAIFKVVISKSPKLELINYTNHISSPTT